MKYTIKPLLGALSLIGLLSCNGIDYEGTYNEGFAREAQARQVYFHYPTQQDTLVSHSFSFEPINKLEHTVELPVRVAGPVSTAPLSYRVSVVKEKTTAVEGKHYIALEEKYSISKGEVESKLPVRVLRSALVGDEVIKLVLRLEPSEDLGVAFASSREIRVDITNNIPQGIKDYWNNYMSAGYGLGPYSDAKFLKLLEYYDSKLEKLNEGLARPDFVLSVEKLYKYFKAHPELGQNDFNEETIKRIIPYI